VNLTDDQAPIEKDIPSPIAPIEHRKSMRSGNGLSDSAMRSKARGLGWSKTCGESVEQFMGQQGWRREGVKNEARWFKID
jgi:hypothetical protein